MPVGDPIPPKPAAFTPDGAPPGVAVDLTALRAPDGSPWYLTRQVISPRLQLVHTNGATREALLPSQINWGNAASSNTKAHYCVNRPQPTKLVPTDRRAIANATVDSAQEGRGDVAEWSIAIETADAGWPTPGDAGGFLYDHAEIVARILAYESIVWDIPLTYPAEWHGAGTACHTEPFEYPHWTLYPGKACPGLEKKRQVRDEILPRAREIRAAWLGTPGPEEEPMLRVDDRLTDDPVPVTAGEVYTFQTGYTGAQARVNVKIARPAADGWLKVWPSGDPPPTTRIAFDAGVRRAHGELVVDLAFGTFKLQASADAGITVDLIHVSAGAERVAGVEQGLV